jgi:TRAP-type transport system periplasmic protein
MKKCSLGVVFLLLAAMAFAGGQDEGAAGGEMEQEVYEFTIAHSEAIGTPLTEALERWGVLVQERSGGRIEAKHFPASQLGSYTQLIEMSRIGTIQATVGGPDTEESVAPEIAVTGLGFIFADEAHVDAVLQGEIGEEMSNIAREKTGVEFVDYGEVGFRHLLANRPVRNLDELEGLKLRVPELNIWIQFWQNLGANPTPLPYAEQYNALSTGVIDGVEADFFSINGFKWYEQAEHLTLTYHWFLPKAIRVNAGWLDSLPADLADIVRETAAEVFADQRRENRANTEDALQQLIELDVQVYELSDAEMAQWLELTQPLYDSYVSQHPEAESMINRILALR